MKPLVIPRSLRWKIGLVGLLVLVLALDTELGIALSMVVIALWAFYSATHLTR